MRLPSLIFALAACTSVLAGELTLQSPRLVITSRDGTQLLSEPISTVKKPHPIPTLGPKDVLRLTFQVLAKSKDAEGNIDIKGTQPHQAFLRFYDPASGEEGIQPVRVAQTGKAKFELNMARPPSSLPPTSSEPLQVSLILGSFVHTPLKQDLFDIVLPTSQAAPVSPEEASFHLLPEIAHTFREEQKLPPKTISAIFVGVVLSPWAVLLGLWAKAGLKTPHLFSPQTLPFVFSLGAFEGLLLWYWAALRLGQVLTYAAILAPITVWTGKTALVAASERRFGRK